MGALRDRYDGIAEVLDDVTVAMEITGPLHRPEGGEPEPWCSTPGASEYVETAVALEHGALRAN